MLPFLLSYYSHLPLPRSFSSFVLLLSCYSEYTESYKERLVEIMLYNIIIATVLFVCLFAGKKSDKPNIRALFCIV